MINERLGRELPKVNKGMKKDSNKEIKKYKDHKKRREKERNKQSRHEWG